MTLKEQQEQILEEKQNEYKGFISQFINDRTEGYSYADEEGIPGYPVCWDYRTVLKTDKGRCLFIYASASD